VSEIRSAPPSDAPVGGGAPLPLQVSIAGEGGSDSEFMPLPLRSRSVQRGARLFRRGKTRDSALTGRQIRAGPRRNRVGGSTKDFMSDTVFEGTLHQWLENAQRGDYYYNGLTPNELATDVTYSHRVRMSCVESRRTPRCSVDLVA